MDKVYIVAIDQSTQSTKAMLIDSEGNQVARENAVHRQIINEKGWVEHDAEEISCNVLSVVDRLLKSSGIEKRKILGVGVANQRETVAAWDRTTGKPLCHAIVWQCNRAKEICGRIRDAGYAETIQSTTGLRLSPFFSASKMAWILENIPGAMEKAKAGTLCFGTMDSWVIYTLTGGRVFKTDCSNASRTQLMNLRKLCWDENVCNIFGIPTATLPEICDSDALFGYTNLGGLLETPVPIHAALGDSHAALFAHGCFDKAACITGYGTGSCVMMNLGESPLHSHHGMLTSVAWRMNSKVCYAFDGVINYSGAVVSWLLKDVGMIASPEETEMLAKAANPEDKTFLVPAFTGIGVPHWSDRANAAFIGMSRTTGRKELVRASLESIAYQISDVVQAMCKDAELSISEMRVAGGPTKNDYLMQFQSDILNCFILIPENKEMTLLGAGYIAGLAMGIFSRDEIAAGRKCRVYRPQMSEHLRLSKLDGWNHAVKSTLQ